MIDGGFQDFADRWNPIFDVFDEVGVKFGLEVHQPRLLLTSLAQSAPCRRSTVVRRSDSLRSESSWISGVDYIDFIDRFADRIYHVHMKDVWWSSTPRSSGVFGGHLNFGDARRYWGFSVNRHGISTSEKLFVHLSVSGIHGPLSIEWEDSGMDRERGAEESCVRIKAVDFEPALRHSMQCLQKSRFLDYGYTLHFKDLRRKCCAKKGN